MWSADTLKCADCHYVQDLGNATVTPVERKQELNWPGPGVQLLIWPEEHALAKKRQWWIIDMAPASPKCKITSVISVKQILSIILLSFHIRVISL